MIGVRDCPGHEVEHWGGLEICLNSLGEHLYCAQKLSMWRLMWSYLWTVNERLLDKPDLKAMVTFPLGENKSGEPHKRNISLHTGTPDWQYCLMIIAVTGRGSEGIKEGPSIW